MLVLYTHDTLGKLNKMTHRIWDERFAVFNSPSSQRFESPVSLSLCRVCPVAKCKHDDSGSTLRVKKRSVSWVRRYSNMSGRPW